jgi:hypothetical protein
MINKELAQHIKELREEVKKLREEVAELKSPSLVYQIKDSKPLTIDHTPVIPYPIQPEPYPWMNPTTTCEYPIVSPDLSSITFYRGC